MKIEYVGNFDLDRIKKIGDKDVVFEFTSTDEVNLIETDLVGPNKKPILRIKITCKTSFLTGFLPDLEQPQTRAYGRPDPLPPSSNGVARKEVTLWVVPLVMGLVIMASIAILIYDLVNK